MDGQILEPLKAENEVPLSRMVDVLGGMGVLPLDVPSNFAMLSDKVKARPGGKNGDEPVFVLAAGSKAVSGWSRTFSPSLYVNPEGGMALPESLRGTPDGDGIAEPTAESSLRQGG